MRKVNVEELESIIRSYASNNAISQPLIVFGGHYQDARIQIVKRIFGNTNFYKISFEDDKPRPDIPYCLYDGYIGDDRSNTILKNCMDVAARIHRPIFCFFDSSAKEKVPSDVLSVVDAIEYVE